MFRLFPKPFLPNPFLAARFWVKRLVAKFLAVMRSGWTPARPRARSKAAGLRLDSARRGFELSIVTLRKAALDHVDSQDHASLVLRANLARMTARTEAVR